MNEVLGLLVVANDMLTDAANLSGGKAAIRLHTFVGDNVEMPHTMRQFLFTRRKPSVASVSPFTWKRTLFRRTL